MSQSVPIKPKALLLFCTVGLIPIALSYGVMPAVTMDMLFGIAVESTELTHIFRAVMGLYLAMALIWFLGAFNASLTKPALLCCAVFMLGLAAGRVLSFVFDGQPHWLFLVYTGLEVVFGVIAVQLYRNYDAQR